MAENEGRGSENWERETIHRLAFAGLVEQRRARRWNIFFRFLIVLWLFAVLLILLPAGTRQIEIGRHTALVEVAGIIAPDAQANADNVISGMRSAFENENAAGVILRINSPGGSPVQAGYISDEIIRLRNKYPDTPLYAVITDICASGGYYVASVADEIYADKASIVGSIGVLMNGFGFVDAMDKLGIERRLLTAGEHKGFLDPFSPAKREDVAHIQKMLDDIHGQFISIVKNGRGERLADDQELFSGYVWTGEKSMDLGLVDGLGSSSYVAREIIGAEKIVDYTIRPGLLERFAGRIGTAFADAIARTLGLQRTAIR